MSFLNKGFAALLIFALAVSARGQLKPGDPFPSLAAADLAGGPLPATDGKVVLVDFWASWCAPCKASFPAYARLQADFAPRGLVILAVSVDDSAADYAAFVRKLAPPFTVVRDQGKNLVRQVKVPGMPTSYLIGRDGKVRFVHEGFHSADTERDLRAQVEAMLAEKDPSP